MESCYNDNITDRDQVGKALCSIPNREVTIVILLSRNKPMAELYARVNLIRLLEHCQTLTDVYKTKAAEQLVTFDELRARIDIHKPKPGELKSPDTTYTNEDVMTIHLEESMPDVDKTHRAYTVHGWVG